MKCLECQHWARKPTDDKEAQTHQKRMGRMGFSNCLIRSVSAGQMFSAYTSCAKFSAADPEVIHKREAFINRSQHETSG